MRPERVIAAWIVAAVAWSVTGCDESLPTREGPPEVLVPSVSYAGQTVRVEADDIANGGILRVEVTNIYDEVLSETAGVHAYVRLSLEEFPSWAYTLPLGADDIVTPGLLVGNTLTVGVNQAVGLAIAPRHTTDSAGFWHAGMAFHMYTTGKGEVFYRSDTVHLVIDGNVQIFKRVPAMQLPRRVYAIVYELWSMEPPPPPDAAYGPTALHLRNSQPPTGR
jgi:hypothetical protein